MSKRSGQRHTETIDELLVRARRRLRRLQPVEAAEAADRGALLVDTRPGWQRAQYGESRAHCSSSATISSGGSIRPAMRGFRRPSTTPSR